MRHLKLIILAFLFASLSSVAQVRFTVEAPASADINSEIRITYTVYSAAADGFQGPSFQDFELLSGPAVSSFSEMSSVNGRTVSASQYTSYTYIVAPKKKGTFTIPAAQVRVGNKLYRSKPITIKIGGSGQKQPASSAGAEEDVSDIQQAGSRVTQKDLYFTVTTNKRRVYEQEPVVLTYKVHWRNGIGLNNVMLKQKPDLKSFLSQEVQIPKNLSPQIEREGSSVYRVATNLQYVLFPQQTGTLSIPPVPFEATVIQRDLINGDPMLTFFNGGGSISVNVTRTTPSLQLEVLPLPSPRPANFSGGVGRLSVKGELLSPTLKTNDVCTYRVTVAGVGNMKLLKTPTVKFPKDFDAYAPKTTDETSLTVDGISGKMVYDYTFVPRNVGTYEFPPVELVYFDSESRNYKTIRTAPLSVSVRQGTRSAEEAREEMALRNSDIRGIHFGSVRLIAPGSCNRWGTWPYVLLHVLLLLAFAVAAVLLRKRARLQADVAGRKRKFAGKRSARRMKAAEKLLREGRKEEFYGELSKALYGYAAERFNVTYSEISKERLAALLAEKGISPSAAKAFLDVADECDYARFAPTGEEDRREALLEQADAAIKNVESELKSKK